LSATQLSKKHLSSTLAINTDTEDFMKKILLKALLLGSVLVMVGCASQPRISSQARPNVDFSAYKSYGWVTPLATDKAGYSTIITSHFKAAVQAQMAARGYSYDASNPDLLVNFFSNVETRTETRSSSSMSMGYFGYRGGYGYGMGFPIYGGGVESRNYKVGTVSIDVVDAKRKELIWEGALEGTLSSKAMQNPGGAIQSAVVQVFTKFPVQSAAVTPAQ
jgi:Domain of unknown function (DUF4136)